MKRTPLRPQPPAERRSDPGWREWHEPTYGRCEACGAAGLLIRHHVVLEQHVRSHGGDPWDLANSLLLGAYACRCHSEHHAATRRLSLALLPDAALAFAVDLLGEQPAAIYLRRYYAP